MSFRDFTPAQQSKLGSKGAKASHWRKSPNCNTKQAWKSFEEYKRRGNPAC